MNEKSYAKGGYVARFDESLILWLFIIGAIVGGMATSILLFTFVQVHLALWVYILIIVVSGLVAGLFLAWLRSYLKAFIMFGLSVAAIGGVAWLLWNAL